MWLYATAGNRKIFSSPRELKQNGLQKCILTGVLESCPSSFACRIGVTSNSNFSIVSLKICFKMIVHNVGKYLISF